MQNKVDDVAFQTEVCHLWNLVAKETREGEVYYRLLEKLEEERKALGGQVFDILGQVSFDNRPLRELLMDAVRYGDQPEVRARLNQVVDKALDRQTLRELIEGRALTTDTMDVTRVRAIREDMERAEARKLQPHFIASFFIEAFLTALRKELPEALRDLQRGSIAPVDLAQAAIGPGMAVFTRYSKVMESDGSPMTVRTALGIINQTLDEVLAEQEGEFDSDTRWALAWFDQFGMEEGSFGVAETLSKAKNTAVNGLVEAGVVKARAGKVQLIGRDGLPDDWNPAKDKRLTVWEVTQHLIRTLEKKGESEAASLMRRLGGMAETARDLAYRLYTVCERKKWAEEALAYNGLVIAWPELTKLAMSERWRDTQQEMF